MMEGAISGRRPGSPQRPEEEKKGDRQVPKEKRLGGGSSRGRRPGGNTPGRFQSWSVGLAEVRRVGEDGAGM